MTLIHMSNKRGSQMERAHMQRSEELIEYRPEGCKWYKPGLGFTCAVKDNGLESFVECLEVDSYMCRFSVFYGYSYYCSCPARVYMAKKLKK
jgi:hypothetical protein